MKQIYNFAIDGNEANQQNRVGSNVFAFQILTQLENITHSSPNITFTILLSKQPLADLPPTREGWKYLVVTPTKLWTQWALPIHLFLNKKKYNVFFTPSHYAPRISAIPYVSSIMDLAFLHYPEQFTKSDLYQLSAWSKYSVESAKKIITISQFQKTEIINYYHRSPADIKVCFPSFQHQTKATKATWTAFKKKHKIKDRFFLYLGTIQPRKNLIRLVEAYEKFCRTMAASKLTKKGASARSISKKIVLPQLVIAGKQGWLVDEFLKRVEQSPFKKQIILTGFVPAQIEPWLYQQSLAPIQVGLYEGFGITALESLASNKIPVVSNSTSLPEVVGKSAILVNPLDVDSITSGLKRAFKMKPKELSKLRRLAKKQLSLFDWQKSAQKVLNVLLEVADYKK